MNLPYMDLSRQVQKNKKEYLSVIESVLDETAFSSGKYVEIFEEEFAAYVGTKDCVGLSSGTSALFMAMKAIDIRPGDEVIVPATTFIASAWGGLYCGATIVFVDCRGDTWEINAEKIEEAITERTKAIIGVHLYGQPFDVDAVAEIAARHQIYLIEDCAQAHGAKYKGKKVGTAGKIGCFSFYPGKNLGAFGEAGAIVSNDEALCKKIRIMREQGARERYYHDIEGYNLRMDGIQGSILSLKLKMLDSWNERRKEIAGKYLSGILSGKITMQVVPAFADPVWHLFEVEVDDVENFMNYMKSNQVYCGRHYPVPCHLQKVFSYAGYKKGDFPRAEYHADHCVSIPMFPEMTDAEVSRVIMLCNQY